MIHTMLIALLAVAAISPSRAVDAPPPLDWTLGPDYPPMPDYPGFPSAPPGSDEYGPAPPVALSETDLAPPSPSTASSVKFLQLVLQMDYATVAANPSMDSQFRVDLVTEVATALQMDPTSVTLHGLQAGSAVAMLSVSFPASLSAADQADALAILANAKDPMSVFSAAFRAKYGISSMTAAEVTSGDLPVTSASPPIAVVPGTTDPSPSPSPTTNPGSGSGTTTNPGSGTGIIINSAAPSSSSSMGGGIIAAIVVPVVVAVIVVALIAVVLIRKRKGRSVDGASGLAQPLGPENGDANPMHRSLDGQPSVHLEQSGGGDGLVQPQASALYGGPPSPTRAGSQSAVHYGSPSNI
mmetsp:Transcript_12170/g.21543  ORF Transcript_12170/g.21543 Transcript_12170/m.21543 type:complete len:354 (+) Transcript_12170:138-1199(+)|eukprot:CAMPEP_0119107982 /NCGR_PEP_ID=MMETSP1180-20130426/12779_1 /TAXON_ID=3052 ORGANISM="Chlamydomonas cf sp, Strain CCMP681" /NCGR_SAMPLE_ID=MMETSP1180 /ASSEMBLY_ACC=CAM_ASM_000741 /LENGTH=353 /DNA_ID=CAMNT_0007093537 /DNA_START=140 /DNA_END=1201 /DNA_ORIENTATION=-